MISPKVLKTIFTKRNLARYYYFINIYVSNWNRTFVLMKFMFLNFNIVKRYNFFSHFYKWEKIFMFCSIQLFAVLGQFPLDNYYRKNCRSDNCPLANWHPDYCHLGKLTPGHFPPMTIAVWTISLDNSYLELLHCLE